MRRPRTLRTRVAALATLAAVVVVALLITIFNVLLSLSLDRDADNALRSRAAAATTITQVRDGHVSVRESPDDAAIDRELWVYERGRPILRSPGEARLQRLADAVAAHPGTFRQTSDEGVRLHSVAITDAGGAIGAVVVGESLAPYNETSDVAFAGSIGLGALLIVLVAVLTWVATGRALAPVREMTRTAAGWSATDHARRFGPGERPDELGDLAETFDALLDRLSASLRHEQRLSAELSHELRTPLARIAAEAELLGRRERSREEIADGLRAIGQNAEEMESILDTLMRAARADAGLDRGRAQLGPLLDRIATRWRPALEADGIALDVSAPDGIDIGVDADVAERILTPMLHNAERYAVQRVSLSAERDGGAVLVHLDDDGPGIPDELREAVFEPGHSGAGGNGAGLGLALARRLARATGGDVDVTRNPAGDGARLRVRLPA
jgi:two-component system heavy metal sensor histidine kinase CusS